MKLVVSEKNSAARRVAEIMAVGAPKADKVYDVPVYRFRRGDDDWVSIGLKGHIMAVDFPDEHDGIHMGSPWRLDQIPHLVDAPVLKIPAEKGIIRALKSLAGKVDSVVIATDYDREGELIGADARDILVTANPALAVTRARFSAITKSEIERALADGDLVSDELAAAGGARQDIDLIWGAVLTRALTLLGQKKMFGDVYSAGRVQTPTLKLIVDLEEKREAFAPEDYWVVKAEFEHAGERFGAGHAVERFKTEAGAQAVLDAVSGESTGTVTDVAQTRRQVKPPAPFNTTSLMAAAASEGMSPAQTMRVAESLYIAGHISYPRVDNTVYPPSLDLKEILRALKEVPQYREYTTGLLGQAELQPTRGEKETTDHPPIHPTGALDPERVRPEEWKIYNLVARRFLATLGKPAVIEGTRVAIDVGGEDFNVKGDVIVTPGFRAIYHYGVKKDEHLPAMASGDTPAFLGAASEAKQTQPPSRYSQGKLIQKMEDLGLGTKATRHDIIQTLYDRKYVENDPVEPTRRGRAIVDALETHAARITSPDMTRELDAEMDAIAGARADKPGVVAHSRALLKPLVESMLEHGEDVGSKLKAAADEDAKLGRCPECGGDLLIKYSHKNKSYFVGCSGYPDCTVTYPLPPRAKYRAVDEPCPTCGKPRVNIQMFRSKPFDKCLDPQCSTNQVPPITIGKCPTGDGGDVIAVKSPTTLKRYARCEHYETCNTSYPLPGQGEIEPTGEPCPSCASPVIVVTTRKGPWRICVNPDCPSREAGKKSWKGNSRGRARGGSKGARSSRTKE